MRLLRPVASRSLFFFFRRGPAPSLSSPPLNLESGPANTRLSTPGVLRPHFVGMQVQRPYEHRMQNNEYTPFLPAPASSGRCWKTIYTDSNKYHGAVRVAVYLGSGRGFSQRNVRVLPHRHLLHDRYLGQQPHVLHHLHLRRQVKYLLQKDSRQVNDRSVPSALYVDPCVIIFITDPEKLISPVVVYTCISPSLTPVFLFRFHACILHTMSGERGEINVGHTCYVHPDTVLIVRKVLVTRVIVYTITKQLYCAK